MAISLDSIRTTKDTKPPRLLIYSTKGLGKTTFAASAPSPIFLQTEDGEGMLELATFGHLKTYMEVIEALDVLIQNETQYRSVVIDSADHLEPLVWQACCAAHGWETIETPGFGKGYVAADAYWRAILDRLDILRNQRNMVVIITAHAEIKRFESPEHEGYDRYDIKLHKRATALVEELVDCILFANYKVAIAREKTGFNNERVRGVGTGERVIYTTEQPAFVAKNRYNLPPEIVLPKDDGWQIFAEQLLAAREGRPAPPMPEPEVTAFTPTETAEAGVSPSPVAGPPAAPTVDDPAAEAPTPDEAAKATEESAAAAS